MEAYDALMEWFFLCCMAFQEEPRLEDFKEYLKDYEKEIREDERKNKTKGYSSNTQDSAGASLSDSKG